MSKGNTGRITVTIILVMVTVASWAWGWVLYKSTMISLWIPGVIAFGAAAATLLPFTDRWQWITQSANRLLNGACHAGVTAGVAFFLFLGYNYYFADDATTETTTATVSGKHSEERTRYRRVGRRHVPREHYNVYIITLEMPDGTTLEKEVPAGHYAKTRRGSKREITMLDGALGFKIIKGYSLK